MLSELARDLNVQQETLSERLYAMERLGFIVRSEGCSEPASAKTSCHCSGCSCCSGTATAGIVGYTLTEKGRRLAGIKKTGDL